MVTAQISSFTTSCVSMTTPHDQASGPFPPVPMEMRNQSLVRMNLAIVRDRTCGQNSIELVEKDSLRT